TEKNEERRWLAGCALVYPLTDEEVDLLVSEAQSGAAEPAAPSPVQQSPPAEQTALAEKMEHLRERRRLSSAEIRLPSRRKGAAAVEHTPAPGRKLEIPLSLGRAPDPPRRVRESTTRTFVEMATQVADEPAAAASMPSAVTLVARQPE